MEGIHFIIDDQGRRVAVQIDLDRHGELWEDFHDALTIEERRDEPRTSFDEVEARFVSQGKLSG